MTAKTLPGRHFPCPEQPFIKAQFAGASEVVGVKGLTVVKGVAGVTIATVVVVGVTGGLGVAVGATGGTGVVGVIGGIGGIGVIGGTGLIIGGYPPKQSFLCQIAKHVQT